MSSLEIYSDTKFVGTLADQRGRQLSIEFFVRIDNAGELHLRFESISEPGIAFELVAHNFGADDLTLYLHLMGTSDTGEFSSPDFYLTGKRSDGARSNPMLTLAGRCMSARITRKSERSELRPAAVAFYTNGFKTFTALRTENEHEKLRMFGHQFGEKHDPPTAGQVVLVSKLEVPSEGWFDGAVNSLRHVARVMSLALDVYIEPRVILEQYPDVDVFSVDAFGPSPQPHVAPFSFVQLPSIFEHAFAMTRDERSAFESYDLPIRWLVAPSHYDEARHIGAMTALEAILSRVSGGVLLGKAAFARLRRKLAAVINEEGLSDSLVDSMCRKLPELNRQALGDKLKIYLMEHDVRVDDFPMDVFGSIIPARNEVVHSGIGRDRHEDITPYMYVARALVTRMILRAANYRGPLRWPNGDGFTQVNL
ncbi:hypothetical protein PPN31114_00193 [Pandoraea pneumonica]|uniref:ApeA N-terminal domain-containing protein n=1 Tax=Pandoraea pneumonica TaxID=2508299 RepID=A0A5E4RK17_9BURK|nr:hypothetical protein [Pandoraea pneumonica]VVD62854.1 hypothetical protein PPN31114_00193 [Pandoraea pneumonica]